MSVTFAHPLIELDAEGHREFTRLVSRIMGSGWTIDALGQRIGFGATYSGERLGLRPGVCLARALAGDDRRYHATTEHLRILREIDRTKEEPPAERRLTPEEYLGKTTTATATTEEPMSKTKRVPGVKDEQQRIEGAELMEALRNAGWKNGQIAYICGYKNDSVVADVLAFKTFVNAEALEALRLAQFRIGQPPAAKYNRQAGRWEAMDERTERRIVNAAMEQKARLGTPEKAPAAKMRDSIPAPVAAAPPEPEPAVVHEPRVALRCQVVHPALGQCTLEKDHRGMHKSKNGAEFPQIHADRVQPTQPAAAQPAGKTLAGTASVVHSLAQARSCFETAMTDAREAAKALKKARTSAEAGAASLNAALEAALPLMRPGLQLAIASGEQVVDAFRPIDENVLAILDRLVADLTIG